MVLQHYHIASIPLPTTVPITPEEWEKKRALLESFARTLFLGPGGSTDKINVSSQTQKATAQMAGMSLDDVPSASLTLMGKWEAFEAGSSGSSATTSEGAENGSGVPTVKLNEDQEIIEDPATVYPEKFHIRLGKSPIHGRGVFATKDFVPREIIEVCPTIEIHNSHVGGLLEDYVYYGENTDIRVVVMGYGMMYNSWREANMWYYRDSENNFVFVAERAIKCGEELTIDYGSEWWSSRETKVGLGYEKDTKNAKGIGCDDVGIVDPEH